MPTATDTAAQRMTDAQATDEALLLLTRKLMRLHPEAYAAVIQKMPEGARRALALAEGRADRVRDMHGVNGLAYPVEPDWDDEGE